MSAPKSDQATVTSDEPAASSTAEEQWAAVRMRPSLLSRLQARIGRRLIRLIGQGLFGFKFELAGLEHVPAGEPVIVAAAPHRSWIDPFLIISALPASPRVVYLGSAEAMFNRRWKRVILGLMGGVVPVSSLGQLNREGLEISLAILAGGNSLGLFPEGWGHLEDNPHQIGELKRGVAFLSQRSGRRVLPVRLAGTQQLWRGKTLLLQVGLPLAPLGSGSRQGGAARLHPADPGRVRDGRSPATGRAGRQPAGLAVADPAAGLTDRSWRRVSDGDR